MNSSGDTSPSAFADSTAAAVPSHLLLIAGRGIYPRLLAESARRHGVRRLSVIAFPGETDRAVRRLADEVRTVRVGAMNEFLAAVQATGASDAVMAGQISPLSLFRARPDAAMMELLRQLPARNARTIFGALVARLEDLGLRVHPACRFMEDAMPAPGRLSRREPDEREWSDIALGRRVAKATSALEVGQTVVVKEGVVLAVEAFEGTDAAIRRGGALAGAGAVVVKTARTGHDLRYDIPVIGARTMRVLRRARVRALAVEAGRTILLERARLIEEADRMNLAWVALPPDDSGGESLSL
ncbi:MAG: UDP-2,3-diacylglucosamine diphosphatase LpxI [Kiritimatiellae bacterium]|nr:UDP-2,3-diacylglucosamine diphosphatase LpxI [Kiritimatiellia bacterium]